MLLTKSRSNPKSKMVQNNKVKLSVLENDRTRFAQWLQQARKSRGYTQDVLAERADVDQGLISKYERAVLPCPKVTVYALAEALMPPEASARTNHALLNSALTAAGFAPENDTDLPSPQMSDYGIIESPNWDALSDREKRIYGQAIRDYAQNLAQIIVQSREDPNAGDLGPSRQETERSNTEQTERSINDRLQTSARPGEKAK